MLDYNLANAAGAAHRLRGADARPRLQRAGGGAARQHRALALQLAAVGPDEAHVRAACSSTWPTPTRARRTRARPIPAAPPAAASRMRRTSGFVVQGDQRNLDANYALSDFDRPHRFSGSFVWELPGQGLLSGFRFSGFVQLQSGLPYSIYSAEPELGKRQPVRRSGPRLRRSLSRSASAGRACAARSTSCASTATTRPRRRSTRASCARRRRRPADIRGIRASAISGGTCCAASGSAAST